MTWHCMLITYTFSSCQSNSLLAADSSAVQFGTLWASQMSALGPLSLFPAGLKGTGDSLSLASADFVLIWKEKWRTFQGCLSANPAGGLPLWFYFIVFTPTLFHIHPKPHLFICLPVWSAAKWVSSFCPKWCCADDNFCQHQIAAWLLIGGFHHSHKPNKTPKPPASVSVKTKQQQQKKTTDYMIHLYWWKKNCSFWET